MFCAKTVVESFVFVVGQGSTQLPVAFVDITEVDYVHLESDTRAVWFKHQSTQGSADGQDTWHKQDVNP